ncbi:MAG TPA: MerR family transcriptional regulator, partial [Acidimicrobiales bacterium]|nr:MerR family transcriptional regulator [Acidimicrobiales bacterium]
MTRASTDRSHLSIGEVLSLLQDEFPDVTISKIRFLESQGLLDPERTPSGYRKFYEGDIDRLRWILRQQKDHYLPLKVIKDRLDDGGAPDAPERNGGPATAVEPQTLGLALALDDRLPEPPPAVPAAPVAETAAAAAAAVAPVAPAPARPAMPAGEAPQTVRRPGRASRRAAAEPGSVSLTADELAQASGLSARDVRDLERFGLLEGFSVGDATYYDDDALVIARTAAGFLQ